VVIPAERPVGDWLRYGLFSPTIVELSHHFGVKC
jgi:hypothetical protein